MSLELLFPTPIWSWRYPATDQLDGLIQRVLEVERQDPIGLQLTNQGGWHSRTTLLEDAVFAPLFAWIASASQGALLQANWDLGQATPCFNNAWAMVSRSGHGVRAHLHPNSLFSGVFYLTAPQGCGAIAFLDPRNGSQMLQHPQDAVGPAMLSSGRVTKEPSPGLLLLFPSWLWHEVEPSRTDEVRISISFNIGMRPVQSGSKG